MAHVANVTIQSSKVTADQTDFPVYINLADMPETFWNLVASGGGDIRVYKSDGATELPREVVDCDTTNEAGELHVKYSGTLSSSSNTVIQIHADGVGSDYAVTATYGRDAVWSDYARVTHMKDATTSTLTDSTGTDTVTKESASNPNENTTSPVFGEYDQNFDDTTNGDYAKFDTTVNLGTLTYQYWVLYDGWCSTSETNTGMSKRSGPTNGGVFMTTGGTPSTGVGYHQFGGRIGGAWYSASMGTSYYISTGTAYHLVGTYDGSQWDVYENGTAGTSASVSSTIPNLAINTYIGRSANYSIHHVVGHIGESRIRSGALSSTWVATEYNNQSDTATFYTATAVTRSPSGDIKSHDTLNNGLVSYWDLQEDSGGTAAVTRYDLVGTYDLTDNGTTPSSTSGIIGNCINCSGSSEWVERASNADLTYEGDTNLSFSVWFKTDSVSGTRTILGKWGSPTGNNQEYILYTNGTTLYFGALQASTACSYSTAISTGTWYHVVITMDDEKNMVLYVNGEEADTGTAATAQTGTDSNFRIGSHGTTYFDGLIDEVGFWDRILSAEEVKDLYNHSQGLPYWTPVDIKNDTELTTNLVSYWELGEPSGDDRVDAHGTNDLTDATTVANANGMNGNGADFEFSNSEYISITDASQTGLDVSGDFTISGWVKPETVTQDFTIVSKESSTKMAYKLRISNGDADKLELLVSSNGTSYTNNTVGSTALTAGTWYHVAAVFDAGTSVTIYLNGVVDIVDTTIIASSIDTTQTTDFHLGHSAVLTSYADGILDEVAFYNKALSVAEVRALYSYASPPVWEAAGDIKSHASLTTDLVSYYDLHEYSAGTAARTRYDLVGSNDLTDINTVGSGTGKIGNANDHVRTNSEYLETSSGFFETNNGSISVWIKYDSLDTNGAGIIADWDYNPWKRGYLLINGSAQVQVGRGGATASTLTTTTTLSAGTWYHLVATWESGAPTKLYINGSLDTTSGANLVTPNNGASRDIQIGAYEYNASLTGWYFDGIIDEIGVWSKVLTTDEITDLYNQGQGLPYWKPADIANDTDLTTNMKAYWEMNGGAGDQVDSYSTNDLSVAVGSPIYDAGYTGNGGVDFEAADGDSLSNTAWSMAAGDFSVSAWIRPESVSGSMEIVTDNWTSANNGFQFLVESAGSLYLRWWDNSGNNAFNRTSWTGLTADTWYHVVASVDVSAGASGVKFWVNGYREPNGTSGGTATSKSANTHTVYVSSNYAGTQEFDGVLDEIAVWNRAIGDDDVRAMYGYSSPPEYGTLTPTASTFIPLIIMS